MGHLRIGPYYDDVIIASCANITGVYSTSFGSWGRDRILTAKHSLLLPRRTDNLVVTRLHGSLKLRALRYTLRK